MTADCMGQHTLTITITSRSTVPVWGGSFPPTLFISGSTTHRQNLWFSRSQVILRDSRRLPMADSSLSQMAVNIRLLARLRISNLSQHNSVRLPQILTTSISTRYCSDSDSFRRDPTSTLRKKPLHVVCVRRKRRKDVDFSKGILTATLEFCCQIQSRYYRL